MQSNGNVVLLSDWKLRNIRGRGKKLEMSRDLTNIKEKFNKLFIYTAHEIQMGHPESASDKGAHRRGRNTRNKQP